MEKYKNFEDYDLYIKYLRWKFSTYSDKPNIKSHLMFIEHLATGERNDKLLKDLRIFHHALCSYEGIEFLDYYRFLSNNESKRTDIIF